MCAHVLATGRKSSSQVVWLLAELAGERAEVEDGGAAQHLVVHGDLEGKAQVVTEALLAGDV